MLQIGDKSTKIPLLLHLLEAIISLLCLKNRTFAAQ